MPIYTNQRQRLQEHPLKVHPNPRLCIKEMNVNIDLFIRFSSWTKLKLDSFQNL